MLYKWEVDFRLLSTNGFHMKANNDRLTAAACRRQNLKFHVVVWQTTSKKMCEKACSTCSMIIFPRSTNQIIDLCRCRCRPHFLNFLVRREQRLPEQRPNLTGSPSINRGFLANIYLLSKFRIHLQSVASITEKKRSPNNSNVTDKEHHRSSLKPWLENLEAVSSAMRRTQNVNIRAPAIIQSSKSRNIQQSPFPLKSNHSKSSEK